MSFHINPNTGTPGRCSAKKGNCPFGADAPHFSTADDARQAFELSQGGSFGISPPLLTTNKKEIKDWLEDMRAPWRSSSRSAIPDPTDVRWDAISRLRAVAEVGFSDKAARQEASRQMNELASELYEKRTSKNWQEALAARTFYKDLLNKFGDRNLTDLRSEDEKDDDVYVSQYDQREYHDGLGKLKNTELEKLKALTEKDTADFTDEETTLVSNYSINAMGSSFSSYTVKEARAVKQAEKAIKNWASLPDYVQDTLGSREELEARVEKLKDQQRRGEDRKEQLGDFIEYELERRDRNRDIEKMLKEQAR